MYQFDEVIDRRHTNAVKYDLIRARGLPEDVIPLWVADMDFRIPKEVSQALEKSSRHGIFGYSESGESYYEAVAGWFHDYFGWEARRDWMVKTPGVVSALATAVRALTREGDAVLIQQPVYDPYAGVVKSNKRELVVNPLQCTDGIYTVDYADFEKKIIEHEVKLFLLCSPHNPVGRVWTEEELRKMGEICLKHNVLVVSDEIHCDFTYPGHRHTVFASLGAEHAFNSIICTAPSKTFNLAGLEASNIFIPDYTVRKRFQEEMGRVAVSGVNAMGLVACEAAYRYGRQWLDELLAYLAGNIDFIERYLKTQIPQVRFQRPEGTYLLWLDFRALGLSDEELEHFLGHRAKIWLIQGAAFGEGGSGFARLNAACPRSVLEEAMDRLNNAVKSL